MTNKDYISVFEITGNEIVGGDSAAHNERFFAQINQLEKHALSIGRALGMKEVTLGVSHTKVDTVGFRFAESSGARFDIKGVEINNAVSAREMLQRLR